jgi:hypothetical protein
MVFPSETQASTIAPETRKMKMPEHQRRFDARTRLRCPSPQNHGRSGISRTAVSVIEMSQQRGERLRLRRVIEAGAWRKTLDAHETKSTHVAGQERQRLKGSRFEVDLAELASPGVEHP